MKKFELSFPSVNTELYSKPVTLAVRVPEKIDSRTGAMMFCHGWGGNRFQHADKMELACDRFNLVCFAPEYRMSGYDFDPVRGLGWDIPYDLSFMQVFDCLNGMRKILELFPGTDRRRLFAYGGSQGGQIALLSSIFAPETFALVYSSSAMTYVPPEKEAIAGRVFLPFELSVRNVTEHAESIRAELFIEHGTADENVGFNDNALAFVKKLDSIGKKYTFRAYDGGHHSLEPAITKLAAFEAMIPHALETVENPRTDDFLAGRTVTIDCGSKLLAVDWKQPADSVGLFTWKEK